MSFFSRFSFSSPENIEKRYYKDQIHVVERVFGTHISVLRNLFPMGANHLQDSCVTLDQDMDLTPIGINALVRTELMCTEQFPLMVNLLRDGRKESAFRHFERDDDGRKLHTLLATEQRYSGIMVRLLTNDVVLLKAIAAQPFSPPPPWVAWYEEGPTCVLERQGDLEYWLSYVWDKFWLKLSESTQEQYIADWRVKTESYISDVDWEEWIFLMRMRDPRYRDREDD